MFPIFAENFIDLTNLFKFITYTTNGTNIIAFSICLHLFNQLKMVPDVRIELTTYTL